MEDVVQNTNIDRPGRREFERVTNVGDDWEDSRLAGG